MDVKIEIVGLNKLQQLAEKYPAVSEKYINDFIVRSFGEIDRNLMPIIPIETNRLRSDLHQAHFSRFQGYIASNLPYAAYVHNLYSAGTSYKHPSLNKNAVAGFLQVAADESRSVINQAAKTAIDGILKEISQ